MKAKKYFWIIRFVLFIVHGLFGLDVLTRANYEAENNVLLEHQNLIRGFELKECGYYFCHESGTRVHTCSIDIGSAKSKICSRNKVHFSAKDILCLARAYALIYEKESGMVIAGNCAIFSLDKGTIKEMTEVKGINLSAFCRILIRSCFYGSQMPGGGMLRLGPWRFEKPSPTKYDFTLNHAMFFSEKQDFCLRYKEKLSFQVYDYAETCYLKDAYSVLRCILNRNVVVLGKQDRAREMLNFCKIRVAFIQKEKKVVFRDESRPNWGYVVKFDDLTETVKSSIKRVETTCLK